MCVLLTSSLRTKRSVAMVLIVIRSKLVLDFALTTHLLHLVIVSLYTGQLPRNLFWYITMAVSSAAGVFLGIWGCQYRELRPVFFGGGGGGHASSGSTANAAGAGSIGGNGEGPSRSGGAADGPVGDEEQGFGRGGEDGGGGAMARESMRWSK